MRTRPLLFVALLALALFARPTPALAGGPTIRVDVDNDHGKDVHLTLGGGLLGSFVRAFAPSEIDCDTDNDPKVRALYLTLKRGGDGTRGSLWDDDKQIDARRTGKLLEMRIREEEGDTVDLTLPWSLARCVLGGEDLTRKEIARAIETGEFSIQVRDEDSEVSISID
jgi:hypothetical protein